MRPATERDVGQSLEEALAMYDDTGRYLFHHFAATQMRLVQDPVRADAYAVAWGPFRHLDAFQMHAIRESGTLVVNTGFFDLEEPEGAALSQCLRQGRKMAHIVAAFIKDYFPGCRHSFVLATADAPGLRRTRWLDGVFTLDRDAYEGGPHYPDAVGRGVVMTVQPMHPTARTFDIPLGCLLPKQVDGLLVGSGRGASCTPAELLRVMPITMAVGQGAGIAAAVAVAGATVPRKVDIRAVRRELARQGVTLDGGDDHGSTGAAGLVG